jgi:hypothetical protein
MNVLKPRQPVPALEVDTLDGAWSLADHNPENFTMVVFYRGLHCPICSKYIGELDKLSGDFAEIGVSVLVLSTDTRERAEQARQNWELSNLNVGYGVTIEQCRDRGTCRIQRARYIHSTPGRYSLLVPDQHYAVRAATFSRNYRRFEVRDGK